MDDSTSQSICQQTLPQVNVQILVVDCIRLTDWSSAIPSRSFWRMYWHSCPGAMISFAGESYSMRADRLFLIPPHEPVQRVVHEPTWSYYIHARVAAPFDRALCGVLAITLNRAEQAWLSKETGMLRRSHGHDAWARVLRATAVMCGMLARVPDNAWSRPLRDARIGRVLAYMEEHYAESIANTDLAAMAHMSVNAFIRRFRSELGIPPQTWLREKRLDRAGELLGHTDLSIEHIAEACGFGERNYFTRLFARREGMGPAAFRDACG